MAPSNTEILFPLGLGDKIIGVTRFCDYPKEAKLKTKMGGWVDVNLDLVKKLEPDLVLTSTIVQDKISNELKKISLNVIHLDPITLEDIFNSILEIGKITGTEKKAENLITSMKERINRLKIRTENLEKIKIYAEEWHKPPFVCGNWIPDLIEIANGIGLSEKAKRSREVSSKEVVEFNPEVIVLTWCGFGDKAKVDWVRLRPNWDKINAIKNNKIFPFDDSYLNRPGPRIVEGLEKLTRVMHPEIFEA